jgi:hypothetical protein
LNVNQRSLQAYWFYAHVCVLLIETDACSIGDDCRDGQDCCELHDGDEEEVFAMRWLFGL